MKDLQEKLNDIHQKLGEYSGIQQSQGKTLENINESLAILAENTVKTDLLMQSAKQHDIRIGILEQTVVRHEETLAGVKDNTYVENYLNKYARTGFLLILSLVFAWICRHIPKIILLLGTN